MAHLHPQLELEPPPGAGGGASSSVGLQMSKELLDDVWDLSQASCDAQIGRWEFSPGSTNPDTLRQATRPIACLRQDRHGQLACLKVSLLVPCV